MLDWYTLLGASAPFDPDHKLVSSPFFSSTVLASIRLFLAFYSLFTLLFMLIWGSVQVHTDQTFFSYFTHISYIGICAYLWASGIQTALYSRRGDKCYPLQRCPRILQAMHMVLQATIIVFPFITTIVFWSVLALPTVFQTAFSAWSNLSIHAFNSLFSLIEIFATNFPPPQWMMLPILLVFLACYLGVAYLTFDTQGVYVYSFLNPSNQGKHLAAYIVGIALACIILFVVMRYLIVLRQYLAIKHGILQIDEDDILSDEPDATLVQIPETIMREKVEEKA